MRRLYFFSIMAVVLSVLTFNSHLFAQDSQLITPVLSEDSISSSFGNLYTPDNILMAQNTQSLPEDDELDDSFLADYKDSKEPQSIADPLYGFNYVMYSLNDFLYFVFLKPLATGYKAITPKVMRKGVNNFFYNLLFPIRFVNNLLQGEIKDAGTEVEIFLINSTVGVLGFGQFAQNQCNLKTSDEDLGQTLGSYSIGNGFYLVLPVLGPSTLRDTIGLAGDYFLTPLNYVEPWELSAGIKTYDTINGLTFRLGDYEALKAAAIDPYIALRDAYIQHRKKKVQE